MVLQHTDDRVRHAIEEQRAANGAIAPGKRALPQSEAEDSETTCVRAVLFREEESAGSRVRTEQRKEVGAHLGVRNLVGPCPAADGDEAEAIGGEAAPGIPFFAQHVELRRRATKKLRAGEGHRSEHDDALRVWVRRRSEEDGIHQREHGRVRPDAQRKGQDAGHGEGR